MKKVLCVSRHLLGEDQLADLHRIYGDVVVVQFADTVESAKQLVEVGKDCDIFAVVLPPALLADLISPSINQKPVIRSVMERVPTGTMIVNPVTGKAEGVCEKNGEICFESMEKEVQKILTLSTCIGDGSSSQRLAVHAAVEMVFATKSGREEGSVLE